MNTRQIIVTARSILIDGDDGDPTLADVEALREVAHRDTHAHGVRDMVAQLLFPDYPEGVAVELANQALKSRNW